MSDIILTKDELDYLREFYPNSFITKKLEGYNIKEIKDDSTLTIGTSRSFGKKDVKKILENAIKR